MSNLIYKLIGAGFKDEAKELIEEALKKKHPHENVGQAFFNLTQKIEQEEQKERTVLERAHQHRKFVLEFAKARFEEDSDQIQQQLEGAWQDSNEIHVNIKPTRHGFIALWEAEEEYKLTGEIHNLSAELIKYKKVYNFGKQEKVFEKVGTGFAYLSNNNSQINILILENKDYSFSTLTRNSREEQLA